MIVLAASASAKPWIYYNSGYPYSNHITSILNSYTAPVSYISSVPDKKDYAKINLRSQKCKNVSGQPVPCAHPAGGIAGNNFYAYNDVASFVNTLAPIPKKSSTPTPNSTPSATPTPTPTPTPKISTSSSTTTDAMDYYYYEYEIHQTATTPKTTSNTTSTLTTPKPPSVNPTTEPEYYYYEYDVDQAAMDPNVVIEDQTRIQ